MASRADRPPVAGHVEQVMPLPRPDLVAVHELVAREVTPWPGGEVVAALLRERMRVGVERYGAPLTAHNGRDTHRDAVEEALDLAAYLRALIEEGEEVLRPFYRDVLNGTCALVGRIRIRGVVAARGDRQDTDAE